MQQVLANAAQPLSQSMGQQVCVEYIPCMACGNYRCVLWSVQVLHRDIKSGNVLLSKDLGVAKICDIGLSHIMGNTSKSLPAAQATFAYAAPEMLMNQRCGCHAHHFFFLHLML